MEVAKAPATGLHCRFPGTTLKCVPTRSVSDENTILWFRSEILLHMFPRPWASASSASWPSEHASCSKIQLHMSQGENHAVVVRIPPSAPFETEYSGVDESYE